jgi:hypothetical protein
VWTAAALAISTLTPSAALANEGAKPQAGAAVSGGVSVSVEAPGPRAAGEGAAHGEGEGEGRGRVLHARGEGEVEGPFRISIDAVFGWGQETTVSPLATPPNGQLPSYGLQNASISVQSYLLGLSYDVRPGLGIGLKVPFTGGLFTPDGGSERGTTSFGNVEIGADYDHEISETLKFLAFLEVTLPTAQGSELPAADALTSTNAFNVNQSGYDRLVINRAAAASRGYEDNALFEPGRVGIIPKVALHFESHGFSLAPYVKLEALIATSSDAERRVIPELVGGLRLAYRFDELEVGARVWGAADLGDKGNDALVLEPELRAFIGPVRPTVGVIIPLTGPVHDDPLAAPPTTAPNDRAFLGLRLGLAVLF